MTRSCRALRSGPLAFAAAVALGAVPAHGDGLAPDRPEAPAAAAEGLWRTPQLEGVNCLYLFLHLAGRLAAYEEVRREVGVRAGGNTFADLRDASGRLGLPAALHKWSPEELGRAEVPVIAHMAGSERGGGRFVVVVQLGRKECLLINGAGAIRQVPVDDFRRYWSGYVLAPSRQGNEWALSLAAGALAVAGYWAWRVRPARARGGAAHRRLEGLAPVPAGPAGAAGPCPPG